MKPGALIEDLSLSYLLRVPSGKADDVAMPLVVILHGRGADANDLAELAPFIDSEPGYRFIFPNAPRPFSPYRGMTYGRSWFDGWPPAKGTFQDSRQLLLKFLNEVIARYPVADHKMVLGGFSQGALMSLDAGFRTPAPLCGIIAMSGALFEEDLADLRSSSNQRVLIIHGTEDSVIPVLAARRARAVLEEHGLSPEYHEIRMGHTVNPEAMGYVHDFLHECMS